MHTARQQHIEIPYVACRTYNLIGSCNVPYCFTFFFLLKRITRLLILELPERNWNMWLKSLCYTQLELYSKFSSVLNWNESIDFLLRVYGHLGKPLFSNQSSYFFWFIFFVCVWNWFFERFCLKKSCQFMVYLIIINTHKKS